MKKIYIMVYWQIYNGFLLIFFAYSESVISKCIKWKKDCEIRSSIAKTIHNLDFPTVSLAAILNDVIICF